MMLDNDQSNGGSPVIYIVFFFVALVLVGGFLDQSHAGTGAFMTETQGHAATGSAELDNPNMELAESSQGNEAAAQTYTE
jgi:hypothetical protein